MHGSGALVRGLLENDLVDEINLFTYPVVVGQGTRLFPDPGPDRAFRTDRITDHAGRGGRQGLPAGRAPDYA